MGAAPSAGRNNDELVDCLIDNSYIRCRSVEFPFRLVDRGDYFPENKRDQAYKDLAWRSEDGNPGFIHLSAPCIYANAIEFLDIQPGQSFLNVGSGTGYFNSVVGFLLTETGVNHGVELYENLIQYSERAVHNTLSRPPASAFGFCMPEFFHGSAFFIRNEMLYDRIYCGAQVPTNRRSFFCRMLKPNGILVMPYGSRLLQIVRRGDNDFVVYRVSNVSFSQLIAPNPQLPLANHECVLPDSTTKPLIEMCRAAIRQQVRRAIFATQPVQVQFEVPTNSNDDIMNSTPNDDAQPMERIGTLYFMEDPAEVHQHNPQPAANPAEQPNEQQQNEAHFHNADQPRDEAIQAFHDELLRHPPPPPLDEQPHPMEVEETPREPPPQIDEMPPHDDTIPAEPPVDNPDQMDPLPREFMPVDEIREENPAEVAPQPNAARNQLGNRRRGRALQQYALHFQRNPRPQPPPPIFPNGIPRRHRLRLNVLNGNRLVGFLNPNPEEEVSDEEDLFQEANGRPGTNDLIGLAPHDKTSQAVFRLAEEKPATNSVDMAKLIPNYVEPAAVPAKKPRTSRPTGSYASAASRNRLQPYALRLAIRDPGPINRLLNHLQPLPLPRDAPPPAPQPGPNQPSTSVANAPTTSATTQTENAELNAENSHNARRNFTELRRDLENASQHYRDLRRNFNAIREPQQNAIVRAEDHNSQPQSSSQQTSSTTRATIDSASVISASSLGPPAADRTSLKRKFDEDEPMATSSARVDQSLANEGEAVTSMPKISRSVSLPSCTRPDPTVKESGDSAQEQPTASSNHSASPVPLSAISARSPSPNPSVATSMSVASAHTASTVSSSSGPDSQALSDTSSVNFINAPGVSTSSVQSGHSAMQDADESPHTSTISTNSDIPESDQTLEDEQRQQERAERARLYHQSLEVFHEEFQRRLRSLPLSERLVRYICYDE